MGRLAKTTEADRMAKQGQEKRFNENVNHSEAVDLRAKRRTERV